MRLREKLREREKFFLEVVSEVEGEESSKEGEIRKDCGIGRWTRREQEKEIEIEWETRHKRRMKSVEESSLEKERAWEGGAERENK